MTSKPQHLPATRGGVAIAQSHDHWADVAGPGRLVTGSAIYDLAPIGAIIRFRDGTPRPPADRPDDLKVWALFNGIGRLAKKDPSPYLSPLPHPVSITLRTAEFGATPAAGVTISLAESTHPGLSFEIIELPPMGSVRILHRLADNVELLHLAADHHAAVRWLAQNPVTAAIFDPVNADEIAAAAVEGRALTR